MNSIQRFFKNIKWRRQRAVGILPECDLWDFHFTLVNYIRQGVSYMLREDGNIDWEADAEHRKMKNDLIFILEWTDKYDDIFVRSDNETSEEFEKRWKEYTKNQSKAFRLLDKYLMGLWD